MNDDQVQTRFLSLSELATVLKLATGTVRNRLSRGEPMPPSVLIGRRRLFPIAGVDQWIDELCRRGARLDDQVEPTSSTATAQPTNGKRRNEKTR